MTGNRSFTFFLTAGGRKSFTVVFGLKKENKDVQTIISPFIQTMSVSVLEFCCPPLQNVSA